MPGRRLVTANNSFRRNTRSERESAHPGEEALRYRPTLGEAHLALGLFSYVAERDYGGGIGAIYDCLDCFANNVEVLLYTARIYRRQGRWREAIAGFEQVRSLNLWCSLRN